MRVDLDDGQHVLARSVVMATGARWRELQAEGVERFRGAGVYHAVMATDAERCRDEDVIVVGGGNSAGQAAMHLATRARSVRVVVRGKALKSTMSHYLVDRIERSPRIEVMTETEVSAVHGTATVESVSLRDRRDGSTEQVPATARLRDDRRRAVHRGGDAGCSRSTPAGYLLCGAGAANCQGHLRWPLTDREPHLLETVRPGVFAAGDVRAGASKRVAGAVGDGALVVRFAYEVAGRLTPMDLGQFGIWTTYRRIGEDRAGEAARLAEELGYSVFWLGGSPRLPSVRPLLEATQGLVIATSIVNIWAYDPARLAAEYAALERDFPGRLLVGIGVGHPEATSDYSRPLSAMRAFLDGLDAAGHRSRVTAGALRLWRRRCSL